MSMNLSNFGSALADEVFRFFALEHVLWMVLAVILAHVGVAASRRVAESSAKHRRAAIWFSLSLVAILIGMHWFRPLLPGLG
jgi:hypothetical protein